MGLKWKKLKHALGFKTCFYVPPQNQDEPVPYTNLSGRFSDAASISTAAGGSSDRVLSMSLTPTPSSSGLRLSKTHSKSSKKTCAICLKSMKPGLGAIFTAECLHSFHFHCITSNVIHGNQICPVCRARWKEIPLQNNPTTTSLVQSHPPLPLEPSRHMLPPDDFTEEPVVFDDDENLLENDENILSHNDFPLSDSISNDEIEVKTFAEASSVPRSTSHNDFTILVHLKAPVRIGKQSCGGRNVNSRVPIDLVTVLDVSGSMSGTKLALLKRAMGFVIQKLLPSDRLSVIAFSTIAWRLFPLTRMTAMGRQQALHAVNSLTSKGGTNIGDGLEMGAKVISDRKWKNPVSSIILLSDGQDTHTTNRPILPVSIQRGKEPHAQIPVHVFGFGSDHDVVLMHRIAEISGGMFSFIEVESRIQDAFAQCIGGLLSVVVQDLQVEITCVDPDLNINSIKAGSYKTRTESDSRLGFINVGDLYAEEKRDFLITVNIPVSKSRHEMSLVKIKCVYQDPVTNEKVNMEESDELKIWRPEKIEKRVLSIEVDRQMNRVRVAEAMEEARVAAENDNLTRAILVLESCRTGVRASFSSKRGDEMCVSLCAELKEMQERMANRRVYEQSGRAYVLSGLSSHSWQRATAHSTNLVPAYQTPSMTYMVSNSQALFIDRPRPFLVQPQPR